MHADFRKYAVEIASSSYIAGELASPLAITKSEEDADTLHRLGWNAVAGECGPEQLRGLSVYLFPGTHTQAPALKGVASSVRVMSEDVSELVWKVGEEKAGEALARLVSTTPEWEDPFFSCFKPLDNFEEQEASWLIPGWVPEGQITLVAADGGTGKTSLWVNIIAALSSGKRCMLDPPFFEREARTVAFMTTEDSVRKKLKKKLRLAGANMQNVITPDFLSDNADLLQSLKFGSDEMARFVQHFKPALCVFDPVQGFVPPDINMGSRNAMRDCMAPLISLGEKTGTSFLVICHTNKRKGAYGRDRIADSADLWDVSRSVLMAGYTQEQGVRYLSNEKNNYAQLQETLLFSVDDDGLLKFEGTTWRRDREYMQEAAFNMAKRGDCKEWILQTLERGETPVKELGNKAAAAGYSEHTLRRAKEELRASGEIEIVPTGSPKDGTRTWVIRPADLPEEWTAPVRNAKVDKLKL